MLTSDGICNNLLANAVGVSTSPLFVRVHEVHVLFKSKMNDRVDTRKVMELSTDQKEWVALKLVQKIIIILNLHVGPTFMKYKQTGIRVTNSVTMLVIFV